MMHVFSFICYSSAMKNLWYVRLFALIVGPGFKHGTGAPILVG